MDERVRNIEDAGDRSTCNVCGGPLVQPRGQGRRRKTCSAACRQKSYMLRTFTRVADAGTEELVVPAAVVAQEPVELPAPAAPVVPDPPAAPPVVVPLPLPKAPRRRSTMTAAAIPLPAADDNGLW